MENNNDKANAVTPPPTTPGQTESTPAPPDPSNTSHIGQKVEQGVISKQDGISEQSSAWEDRQEPNIPGDLIDEKARKYIKEPSPEEKDDGNQEANADDLINGPNNAGKPNNPDNNPAL